MGRIKGHQARLGMAFGSALLAGSMLAGVPAALAADEPQVSTIEELLSDHVFDEHFDVRDLQLGKRPLK